MYPQQNWESFENEKALMEGAKQMVEKAPRLGQE